MSRIALNEQVFESTVNQMKKAKADLSDLKPLRFSLQHTDLNSIKAQLEVIEELYETLQLYSTLLDLDVSKLQETGRAMVQLDQNISRSMNEIMP